MTGINPSLSLFPCSNVFHFSLRTNLCLQYKPQFIASAAIYLASKFLKYTLAPDGKKLWWEVLDAKIDELEGMFMFSFCSFLVRC